MSNTSAASGARVTYVTMTAFSSDKGRKFVRVRAKFSPHISAEEEWSWWEDIHRRTRLGAIFE